MPKYIDADALKEAFLIEGKDVYDDTYEFYTKWGASQELIEKVIDSAPAADVEPVIHCKDCVHSCPEKGHEPDVHCSWWDYPMPPMGFCSKATRKKGEE